MLNEFKAFIAKGNVMDMAVGIIIGAAFTAIVSSMVADQTADKESTQALEYLIQARLDERQQARAEKNWARSDEIRDELAEAGIKIEDSSNGATWSIERKQQR